MKRYLRNEVVRMSLAKWILASTFACLSLMHGAPVKANTVTYVYTDPQGTPLAEADVNGNITATFDYTPYGSQALGTAPNGPGYTGHVNDPDTGLVYMQARYYDPVVGRFLSVDPVGPSAGNAFNFNRFSYANNNPIINDDPTGECTGSHIQDSVGNCADSGTSTVSSGPSSGGVKQIATGVSKSIINGLTHASAAMGDSEAQNTPDLKPSNDAQATGELIGSAAIGVAGSLVTDGESAEASAEGFVDLAAPQRRTHILYGDEKGGGHIYGLKIKNKSEFPQGWSGNKIMHVISDIATDPHSSFIAGRHGRMVVNGTREGIDIQVILGRDGNIVTGYPTNTGRNP